MPPPDPALHVHTVLIVEDDAGMRDAIQAMLITHKHRVLCARGADHALTLLRCEPRPCVVVLDLMMLGVNGDDFRRAQLADPTVRTIPVILVSGVHDLAERAKELHAAAFIAKPLDIGRLVPAIAQHCSASGRLVGVA